jgi:hypothetical protein
METTMQTPPPAQRPDVAALARCAALDLSAERLAAAEAILSVWIPAANELSRKMSDPAHQAMLPLTVFTHAHEQPESGE